MIKSEIFILLISILTWWNCDKEQGDRPEGIGVTGTVKHHRDVPSEYVDGRNVDIWLPPSYGEGQKYPVIYMHDGQNLFDPSTSYIGVDWGIDETMTRLIEDTKARAAIVVGIWNTPKRVREYMPQKPLEAANAEQLKHEFEEQFDGPPISDDYLRFLVQELKPFVDSTYSTLADGRNTFIMGSSMGGLISLYALLEYPEVFTGAGCVSTHWPIGDPAVIDYVAANLPHPQTHRIYFDYGTETLDEQYEPYQERVNEIMKAAGYQEGKNWMTKKFIGHEHSEKAWKQRVHAPLAFLLGASQPR